MNKAKTKPGFGTKLFYGILAVCIRIAAFVLLGFKLKTDPEVKAWKRSKEGLVILCEHPSELDAVVLLAAAFPRYTRFVAGAQQLYKGTQGKLLRKLKVIPKKQFVPDLVAIKEMMRTVRDGMVLAMMPEGRVSMDGKASPNDISTAKLIKKLGVNVAILKPHGSYYVKPPYNYSGLIKGEVSGECLPLFRKEELAEMSAEEILEKLTGAFDYNAGEELRGSGRTYGKKKEPAMEKVGNMFYRCPACGSLYSITQSPDKLHCSSCGLDMLLSRDMFFKADTKSLQEYETEDMILPDNVTDWNDTQLAWERAFWKKENASLVLKVRKSVMTIGVTTVYEDRCDGTLTLSEKGLHYEDGEEVIDVPLHTLQGVSADYMYGHILCYSGNDIRKFKFENEKYVARFVNSLMILKGAR